MRFVIWDLDGTLIDSGSDIVRAANAARADLGLAPLPAALIRSFVGEGARRLMERVVGEDAPAALHDRAVERYLARYGEDPVRETRPYAGLDAIVRRLAPRQAIATNKPSALSRRIVELLGWEGLFTTLVGGGDVPRKPAPDAIFRVLDEARVPISDAIFVGDSPIDIATAAAAGIDFVGVSWGLRPREELLGAPRLVDSADELARALVV